MEGCCESMVKYFMFIINFLFASASSALSSSISASLPVFACIRPTRRRKAHSLRESNKISAFVKSHEWSKAYRPSPKQYDSLLRIDPHLTIFQVEFDSAGKPAEALALYEQAIVLFKQAMQCMCHVICDMRH